MRKTSKHFNSVATMGAHFRAASAVLAPLKVRGDAAIATVTDVPIGAP